MESLDRTLNATIGDKKMADCLVKINLLLLCADKQKPSDKHAVKGLDELMGRLLCAPPEMLPQA